ncbi:MAG: NAD(P)-dependent oxidoreductase [Flavobacteriales bacterium]|jgi:saccharopine dehydrogenase (NAD+, L-lysine-forming)
MEKVRLGIVREGKVPPDFRVPLTPEQCKRVMEQFPHVEVIVQPSPIRKFQDDEYRSLGIRMEEDLSICDYLMGVKEVPLDMLIPNKTYLFFSHTLKKQPHNAKLLKTILEKKIRLIDYETLKGTDGKRIIGFGRYAGIVGAYHGFRTLGLKKGWYELKRPVDCADRKEMESEMNKIQLPKNTKIVVTGFGRVGNGASEIFQLLPIRKVTPKQFLTEEFDEPVYVHLDTHEYYERKVDGGFDKKDFYNNPDHYFSILPMFVKRADMYVACHLWAGGNPVLITNHDISQPDWKCMVIADVSCDTNGPIAPTIRASKIADPIYGYDRMQHVETDYKDGNAIAMMAIDNLPCELPKDASEDFGDELLRSVFPLLFGEDPHDIIWKATETTLKGELTPHFEYLHDYAANA